MSVLASFLNAVCFLLQQGYSYQLLGQLLEAHFLLLLQLGQVVMDSFQLLSIRFLFFLVLLLDLLLNLVLLGLCRFHLVQDLSRVHLQILIRVFSGPSLSLVQVINVMNPYFVDRFFLPFLIHGFSFLEAIIDGIDPLFDILLLGCFSLVIPEGFVAIPVAGILASVDHPAGASRSFNFVGLPRVIVLFHFFEVLILDPDEYFTMPSRYLLKLFLNMINISDFIFFNTGQLLLHLLLLLDPLHLELLFKLLESILLDQLPFFLGLQHLGLGYVVANLPQNHSSTCFERGLMFSFGVEGKLYSWMVVRKEFMIGQLSKFQFESFILIKFYDKTYIISYFVVTAQNGLGNG